MNYKQLLRDNPKHYLWDKSFKDWTEEDKNNLIKGVDIPKLRKKYAIGKQPVRMTCSKGAITDFVSVAQASRETGLTESVIHATINGRQKTAKKYKFERI